MSLSPNLTKWIVASVADYFKTALNTITWPILVDGIDERDGTKIHSSHIEIRISGPFIKELSHKYYRIQVDINSLIEELMKLIDSNVYELQDVAGAVANAMAQPINVYKYGLATIDDESWFGCLILKTKGLVEPLRILQFGQAARDTRIRQIVIDGHYEMFYKE